MTVSSRSHCVANSAEAGAILTKEFASHDLEHWRQVLADEPGVWAAMATPREALNDPQTEPNGYLVTNVDGNGEKYRIVASPVQFNEVPPDPARAPEYGQHTEEILLELGVDWEDIAAG